MLGAAAPLLGDEARRLCYRGAATKAAGLRLPPWPHLRAFGAAKVARPRPRCATRGAVSHQWWAPDRGAGPGRRCSPLATPCLQVRWIWWLKKPPLSIPNRCPTGRNNGECCLAGNRAEWGGIWPWPVGGWCWSGLLLRSASMGADKKRGVFALYRCSAGVPAAPGVRACAAWSWRPAPDPLVPRPFQQRATVSAICLITSATACRGLPAAAGRLPLRPAGPGRKLPWNLAGCCSLAAAILRRMVRAGKSSNSRQATAWREWRCLLRIADPTTPQRAVRAPLDQQLPACSPCRRRVITVVAVGWTLGAFRPWTALAWPCVLGSASAFGLRRALAEPGLSQSFQRTIAATVPAHRTAARQPVARQAPGNEGLATSAGGRPPPGPAGCRP